MSEWVGRVADAEAVCVFRPRIFWGTVHHFALERAAAQSQAEPGDSSAR